MKLLPYLTFILVLACNQTDHNFGALSGAEQDNLRARAAVKCLADTERTYQNFKDDSDDLFNSGSSSTNFHRNRTWIYSQTNGTFETFHNTYTVWKVDGSNVYFIVTIRDKSAGTTRYQFLRITTANNNAMIDHLRSKGCAQDLNFVLNLSDSSFTLRTIDGPTNTGVNEFTKTTYDYSGTFSEIAYFATLHFTKTITVLDQNQTQTSSTTITGKITTDTDTVPLYSVYTDYNAHSLPVEFCAIKPVTTSPDTFTIPYELGLECNPTPANNPAHTWIDPSADL